VSEGTGTPGGVVGYGTLDDFVRAVEAHPSIDWRKYLFWALGNKDLTARVEIVNWMLDNGADPAQVDADEKINALHAMFEEREHDFVGEAKLLQRLLDGGADINLKAPKWNVPIYALWENSVVSDEELAPFYDVLFSYPGIDWDVIVKKVFGVPTSFRDYVDHAAKRCPELHRRMHDYLENGPSPRPVFD